MTVPELNSRELRRFGLTTGAILIGLFGLLFPWWLDLSIWKPWIAGWTSIPPWPWVVGGGLWLWAITAPQTMRPLYKGWMMVGQVLGWINTRIILGLLFFVVFTPTALIMRLLGKDPMRSRLEAPDGSYRIPSSPKSSDHLERPF